VRGNSVTLSAKHLAIVLLGSICGLIFFGHDFRAGIRIRVFDLGMILVAAIYLHHALSRGVSRQVAPFVLSFGVYALYLSCNALVQGQAATALKETVQLMLFGVFFLSLAQFLDDRRSLVTYLTVALTVLWALALHNAYVHVAEGSFAGWKDLGDQKLTHSVIVLVMAAVTVSPFRPKGAWWTILLVAAVAMLLLSGERKGWVATGLAVVVALVISSHGGIGARALRRTLLVGAGAMGVIALTALVAPVLPYLDKQLFSSMEFVNLLMADGTGAEAGPGVATTESNRNRIAMMEIALQQWREAPVFGVGPEAFRSDAAARAYLPIPTDRIASGPHNEILRIGAELGAVGLTLYLAMHLVVAFRAVVLVDAMARLDDAGRLRVRLGVALFVYGFVVNLFLAGGGLNTFFVVLPAALLFSVRLPGGEPARPLRRGRAFPVAA
jgi:O-antigen ligase